MTDTSPSWYHGSMSAEEATAICVKVGQNGAFLVRESQGAKGAFTLSVFFRGQVYHHRILPKPENRVMLESSQKEFDSLEKLVDQYKISSDEFIHPLTIAIFPSLVKQLNDDNWKPDISPVSPVYVVREQVNKPNVLPPISIPKPNTPKPNVSRKLPEIPKPPTVASKPAKKSPAVPKKPQTSPKILSKLPQLPQPPKVASKPASKPSVNCEVAQTLPEASSVAVGASEQANKHPVIPKVPKVPTSSASNEENLPASLSTINSTTLTQAVKPHHTVMRTRSDSSESQRKRNLPKQSSFPQQSLDTFGKTVQDVNKKRSSKKEASRPVSCFGDIELVCDEPEGGNVNVSDEAHQQVERKRTFSANDMHRMKLERDDQEMEEGQDTVNKTINSPQKSPHSTTKTDQNKLSTFKTFRHFLNRIGKGQKKLGKIERKKSKEIVEEEVEPEEQKNTSSFMMETNDVFEGNNNNYQPLPEDCTPILCKTQFVTTTDYSTSENALSFTKDTEMAVRAVRMDGWWYCENLSTQEKGWVYMDYLKPKNEKWFEAKPVETTQDYEIYHQLNFGSSTWDPEFDDDTYCKYNFPAEDTNTGGNAQIFDQDEEEVPT